MATIIHLGNESVLEQRKIDEQLDASPENLKASRVDDPSVTEIHLPDDHAAALASGAPSFADLIARDENGQEKYPGDFGHPYRAALRDLLTSIRLHTDANPSWVVADDPAIAELLQQEFRVGAPSDEARQTARARLLSPLADERRASSGSQGDPVLARVMRDLRDLDRIERRAWARRLDAMQREGILQLLKTNNGVDLISNASFGTSAQPAALNYIGLTANAAAPAAGDTTLTGEIATAGGGLLRAQATYSHTAGTTTSALVKTFTANGTDVLPVTIAKIGIFNAVTAGIMGLETLLSSTATLSASGDNVQVTDTLTFS